MSILNKLGFLVVSFSLRTTLFFGFTLLAAVIVFGNRENVKTAILDADAYERFTQSIIDSAKEQSQLDPNSIPLEDDKIADIFRSSLDQKSTRAVAESGIDSVYDWLEGDTKQFTFKADLTANKERLAKGVSNYAVERLEQLPVCPTPPTETNVFRLNCNPQYLDQGTLRKQIYEALINDTSIFKKQPLTEADFPKADDGSPIYETYAKAPKYFMYFKIVPYIILGISLICSLILIFSSRRKRNGLKIIASSIIGTGIFLAVTPILYMYVLPAIGLSLPGAGGSDQSVSAISNAAIADLYSQFNGMLINIALQVLTVGIVLLIILKFMKPTRSPYSGIDKKAGLAVSIDASAKRKGPKISSTDIPIQTSHKPYKSKKKATDLEKRFRKL